MLTLGSARAMVLFKFVLTFLFLYILLYIFFLTSLLTSMKNFAGILIVLNLSIDQLGEKLNVNDTASSNLYRVYIHIFNQSS